MTPFYGESDYAKFMPFFKGIGDNIIELEWLYFFDFIGVDS